MSKDIDNPLHVPRIYRVTKPEGGSHRVPCVRFSSLPEESVY